MSHEQIWEAFEEMQGKIAAEIRKMLKEPPIDPRNFGPESQARRIKAMQECCVASETDEERHEKWLKQHQEDGWTEGEYNEEAKTHPNMLPWECLPRPAQAKARIFDIVAKTAAAVIDLIEKDKKFDEIFKDWDGVEPAPDDAEYPEEAPKPETAETPPDLV